MLSYQKNPLKREEAKEHASLGCYEKVLIFISCFYDYSITGACEGCLFFELTIFKEFVNKRRRRCADGNAGGETFPQKGHLITYRNMSMKKGKG